MKFDIDYELFPREEIINKGLHYLTKKYLGKKYAIPKYEEKIKNTLQILVIDNSDLAVFTMEYFENIFKEMQIVTLKEILEELSYGPWEDLDEIHKFDDFNNRIEDILEGLFADPGEEIRVVAILNNKTALILKSGYYKRLPELEYY